MEQMKMHLRNKTNANINLPGKNPDFENVVLMIKQSQLRAYSSVNRELIDLYYNLGKYISLKVANSQWGKGVVKELADYIENTKLLTYIIFRQEMLVKSQTYCRTRCADSFGGLCA